MPSLQPQHLRSNSDEPTSVPPLAERARTVDSVGCPFATVRLAIENLRQLYQESTAEQGPSPQHDAIVATLTQLANAVFDAEVSLQSAKQRSEKLSTAQAEAIVRSAETIEELERTRADLLEARRIAERHQAERLQLLGRVFENAREGVVILDDELRIQEANPVFQEIAGRDEAGLLGRQLNVTLEWAFSDYEAIARSVRDGHAWSGRVVVARGDKDERSYLVSFSPVHTETDSRNVIVMFSDVTDIDQTQRRLKRQALHDQLTGLPNRRFFRERIQSLIDESARNRSTFAVCFIDLDDFKNVNDTLGHLAGDELLMEVARRIQLEAGDESFAARFGGDEFALLIPNTNLDFRKTAIITDCVLKSLREPILVADTVTRIGASIGVTEYPTHSSDLDELMQNADVAMYAAKQAGRNQIRVFESEMRRKVEHRHRIRTELHRALHGNEISVLYQPQIDLKTGELVNCEALARWRTPDGRNISPGEFVPVAEKSGLICSLGELVLTTVCAQLVDWESSGLRPPRTSVNVSPKQLHSRRYANRVASLIESTGASPEWIVLEITENAVMEDVESAMLVMRELNEMGIQLALDDFGTGHSSLSYLKLFDIHTLKIDRSFVMDLPVDERAKTIVESIIHLGQGRKLKVVAEGIETREQYEMLAQMGCDYGQGFCIAHPLRAVEFEAWSTPAPCFR
ncbi:MAG: EAL domain-containing protein [Planctomycetaceae bacterium]